jgi:hypothetical protein
MKRRDSNDSTPSQPSTRSASERPSLSSSVLGHFASFGESIQRRLSGGLSTSPSSSNEDAPRIIHDTDPPLSPITLKGFSETTVGRVLDEKFAEEIRLMMPVKHQLQDNWDLVYSLEQHGVSLATLYARSKSFNSPQAGFVIIVRDQRDNIFGAYLSDYPHIYPHYYGNGECFLFKFNLVPEETRWHTSPFSHTLHSTAHPAIHKHESPLSSSKLHSPTSSTETSQLSVHESTDSTRPSSSGSNDSRAPQYQFKGFSYTGLNDYMILCTPQFLSVGGGYFH